MLDIALVENHSLLEKESRGIFHIVSNLLPNYARPTSKSAGPDICSESLLNVGSPTIGRAQVK
jgi:hypothetical protein